MITIDTKILKHQIEDLLASNIPEGSKNGLHHLLGELHDQLCKEEEIQVRRFNR